MTNIPPYNQEELLSLVAEGDEKAFRQLFDHYESKIYSVALRITKSSVNAEELLQDIFLRVWLRRDQLSGIRDFDAYLFTIARNEAYKALKKIAIEKKRSGGALSDDLLLYHTETEEAITMQDYTAVLRNAVEKLPPQQKQVYQLIREQGLTREQAAGMMHISSETVKTHLERAMKTIRATFVSRFGQELMVIVTIHLIFYS